MIKKKLDLSDHVASVQALWFRKLRDLTQFIPIDRLEEAFRELTGNPNPPDSQLVIVPKDHWLTRDIFSRWGSVAQVIRTAQEISVEADLEEVVKAWEEICNLKRTDLVSNLLAGLQTQMIADGIPSDLALAMAIVGFKKQAHLSAEILAEGDRDSCFWRGFVDLAELAQREVCLGRGQPHVLAVVKQVYGVWQIEESGLRSIDEVQNLGSGNWFVVTVPMAQYLSGKDASEELPLSYFDSQGNRIFPLEGPRYIGGTSTSRFLGRIGEKDVYVRVETNLVVLELRFDDGEQDLDEKPSNEAVAEGTQGKFWDAYTLALEAGYITQI